MTLQHLLPRGTDSELRVDRELKREARFEGNQFERLSSSDQTTRTLRLLQQGKLVSVKSTRLRRDDELVRGALSLAPYGTPCDVSFADPCALVEMNLEDTTPISDEEMILCMDKTIQELREIEPQLNITAKLISQLHECSLTTSRGFEGHYRKTLWNCDLRAELMNGDEKLALRSLRQEISPRIDFTQMKNELLWILSHARDVIEIESGDYPVMFSPEMMRFVLYPVYSALSGLAVSQGDSPLADKLGQKVFDSRITLIDDATKNGHWGSLPFDLEGTPTQRTVLIDQGIASGVMLDRRSGLMLGRPSTGNAGMSFFTFEPLPQHLSLAPGTQSFQNMIHSIKRGILIVTGMCSANATTVSGSITLGLKIENGEVIGRVKECMFGFNVFDYLKQHLIGLTEEIYQARNHQFPCMLLDKVFITAK